MKGLTSCVRFSRGVTSSGDALCGEGLKVELLCDELLRLSAATRPRSSASTSSARTTAPRLPIRRHNSAKTRHARVI